MFIFIKCITLNTLSCNLIFSFSSMNSLLKTKDVDLIIYQRHQDDLLGPRLLGPSSDILIKEAWLEARACAFQASSWVMLKLWVQGHTEKTAGLAYSR